MKKGYEDDYDSMHLVPPQTARRIGAVWGGHPSRGERYFRRSSSWAREARAYTMKMLFSVLGFSALIPAPGAVFPARPSSPLANLSMAPLSFSRLVSGFEAVFPTPSNEFDGPDKSRLVFAALDDTIFALFAVCVLFALDIPGRLL